MTPRLSTIVALISALLLAPTVFAQGAPSFTRHSSMCDASAAVPIGSTMFVVANDEDNVLRVYERDKEGAPLDSVDLASFLQIDAKHPEADIEGATLIGDRIYWITSHGANKNGKPRPNRRRLFATDVQVGGGRVRLTPVGVPYQDLVKDLAHACSLKDEKLGKAADAPPEEKGGLNIEGLSRTPQGELLIAFRNPIPDGKSLVVPLENPEEVIQGKAARLRKPISIALGGLGIRSIEYFEPKAKYLIVAGPHDDGGDFRLYEWSGRSSDQPALVKGVEFPGLRPEALIVYPGETSRVQVLSDDGSELVDGKDCKDEAVEPAKKSFRSIWVSP